jgi:hypothetical protein
MPATKRDPNFQPFEDLLLSKTYVRASQDPQKGNEQTATDFWKNVTNGFCKLLEDYTIQEGEILVSRVNHDKKKNRFSKHITSAVNKFRGYFVHEERNAASGVNDPDSTLESAKTKYRENQNKDFLLEACYDVLKVMPKCSTSEANAEVGCAFTNVSSKSERPEGTKATI